MVSGFLTSPLDQERIDSGEATEMATYSTWFTLSSPSNSRVDSLVIIISFSGSGAARLQIFLLTEISQNTGLDRLVERVRVADFHIHAQRLHFLDEHVKGFRDARFEAVVTFDNALVNAGAALHVVRLDGEQFLQRVGRAIGFHGPHFHFAETLAAVLGLATER